MYLIHYSLYFNKEYILCGMGRRGGGAGDQSGSGIYKYRLYEIKNAEVEQSYGQTSLPIPSASSFLQQ